MEGWQRYLRPGNPRNARGNVSHQIRNGKISGSHGRAYSFMARRRYAKAVGSRNKSQRQSMARALSSLWASLEGQGMIQSATVNGRPAMITYLDDKYEPVEDEASAEFIKVVFTDDEGGYAFLKAKPKK